MEAENRIERTLGLVMLAVLAVGCLLVLRPFFTAFCFALILVVATWPTPRSSEAGRYGHVLGGMSVTSSAARAT
jgi:predicted PurR-regulated permease PerM